MINAQIVADSISEQGHRITSMLVTLPKYLVAEFNTHRMFSRNSASSRAIPFSRMADSVLQNPFMPIAWQKEHIGMQGTEYIIDPEKINKLNANWKQASIDAVGRARNGFHLGTTKQMLNRMIEAYVYTTILVTSTEWENFFALRCPQYYLNLGNNDLGHNYRSKKDYTEALVYMQGSEEGKNEVRDKCYSSSIIDWLQVNKGQAEIHIMALAEKMWDGMNESTPKKLQAGEWHIPMINIIED